MAGPSSFVPSPVSPSKPKQRFTLDQANRSLPLVSRIVRDIVATHQKIASLQEQSESKGQSNRKQAAQTKSSDREMENSADRLNEFVEELTSIGVELKDYETGLVDFVGRHQGHDVYLCWKLGEQKIGFWHELKSGFAGRQPIATLEESE